MLSRDEFCKLTGLPLESLKSRARRMQMPFEYEGDRKPHGYSLFDAFLTICTLHLGGEPLFCHPATAASIVKSAANELEDAWPRILASARKLQVDQKHRELVWTRVWVPGLAAGKIFVGTDREVLGRIEEISTPITYQLTQSASRPAYMMLLNAEQDGIEIPDAVRKAKTRGNA